MYRSFRVEEVRRTISQLQDQLMKCEKASDPSKYSDAMAHMSTLANHLAKMCEKTVSTPPVDLNAEKDTNDEEKLS